MIWRFERDVVCKQRSIEWLKRRPHHHHHHHPPAESNRQNKARDELCVCGAVVLGGRRGSEVRNGRKLSRQYGKVDLSL
jgi:hypothetical protein